MNSNARTRVYISAFILRVPKITEEVSTRNFKSGLCDGTYSVSANRYPMHARGPPRKDIVCAHTPGMLAIASGGFSHRSGLHRRFSEPPVRSTN